MNRPLRRFMFKLASHLRMDVRAIEQWPSSLISEWLAYDQLDPIPDTWWQMGMLASIMCNAWGGKRLKPEDFIPRVRTKRRQDMQEQRAILVGAATAAEAQAGKA